MEKGVI